VDFWRENLKFQIRTEFPDNPLTTIKSQTEKMIQKAQGFNFKVTNKCSTYFTRQKAIE
jgi:hypothetical protein